MTNVNRNPILSQKEEYELARNILSEFMKAFKLNKEEKSLILDNLTVKRYKKGTILLREGEISNKCYFSFKGVVREYYLKDGLERTTNFYTEGDSITSALSNIARVPAKHYLECIDDCILSECTMEEEQRMFERIPKLESICRVETGKKLGEYQEQLASFITSTPEERYLNLMNTRPQLINRVPQYQLASYLGVKPESLSRIRKRILQKSY